MNYDYYNKFTDIPTLLLGDWTYDIVILDRLKRKPYFFEKWFFNYQNEAICNSNVVISLFKDCAQTMRNRYKNNNIFHLGINGINDMSIIKYEKSTIIEKKLKSKNFLFIGSPKYLQAAQLLVDAFNILKQEFDFLELNIIGINSDLLISLNSNIHCWGYLDKDKEADNLQYYKLMSEAKCVVNPSELWAGYSSIIEAMYYFNPIITTPYEAFVLDFGISIDFGYYLENLDILTLSDKMKRILIADDYIQLGENANKNVLDFTWDNYVDKMITLMNSYGK